MINNIMLELVITCVSVIANLLLAVLVFLQNTKRNVNRYFAFFAVVLSCWSITNYISVNPFWLDQLTWIRLDMAWSVLMSMALLMLINVFPTGEPFYSRLNKLVAPPGVAIAVFAMSPWLFTSIDYSSGSPQPTPGPIMAPFALYTLIILVFSVIILIRRFLKLKDRAKEYIRYAIVGVILTFSLLVIFNFIAVVAFRNTSFIPFSPLITLIFTASFAYGMIRHQLFDIRLIVARFVAYLLLLLFIGVVYSFVSVGASFLVAGIQPDFTQVALSTLAVGVLILFVEPLRKFLNRITRAIFYQDAYETKDILDKLSTVLVRSMDTTSLIKNSAGILKDALKAEYITVVLISSPEVGKRRSVTQGMQKEKITHSLSDAELAGLNDMLVADLIDESSDRMQARLQNLGIAVIARLKTSSGIIGYIFFGDKVSGGAYSRRDTELIRISGDELAVAIQNAIHFEQIQEFNETLKQRIQEATKELRATNSQLQRLDEAKDEFISMASHQLRTPLTSVKGYISMVLEGDAGKIGPQQKQLLSEAFASSERMVHLINDFLNVSRLQTGKFMLEQRAVDLTKVVTQEVESLQTTVKMHDLKLKFKAPSHFPILFIDEGKIRQVIMNFIDNAIYYSRENSTITVALSVMDGDAVLEVHDTGIGVPKDEQAHLFGKFFRATNARKQRPDGTGVGLFLAKKVIVAHGGSMVFHSVEGEGSTFGFRLPVKKLSAGPAGDGPDKLHK